ncbi:MAG: hypothetical protein HQL87_02990 [Magnetococcales bacterium]|nr:hypothetical protein [Magnetococcales bacterium]
MLMKTLYKLADEEIRSCIFDYLAMAESTHGLTDIRPEHLDTERKKIILLTGINVRSYNITAWQAVDEWKRRQALHFDLETAITTGVYVNIREAGSQFLDEIEKQTNGFSCFTATFIRENPHCLPIFQHLAGVFSKSALKTIVGSVSDNSISGPASERLSKMLKERVIPDSINKGEILQRLEATLEGIVRDLVGRVLLESIVDSALNKQNIPFQREDDYASLSGVLYDFRADFVLPDAKNPRAFIEVRKSSARHASLYAKDKMFSAINWKGRHKDLLGVLVVDGEWTSETLRVMANVFDYVVPMSRISELTEIIALYLAGDTSKLKWLIHFKIEKLV